MSRFVLDNTVTMAWCFTDEATDTETLLKRLSDLTDTAFVPALWLYEVVNVVELAVRKGRIAKDKAFDFLESLAELPIEVEDLSHTAVFVSVRALAERSPIRPRRRSATSGGASNRRCGDAGGCVVAVARGGGRDRLR